MPTVAAVSFLNARPLIEGLAHEPGIELRTDVPSRLLELLLGGGADIALAPVIDFQTAPAELCIVPVGAIGSDGPTHTVRVFSRSPLPGLDVVHVDGDSHTSAALLQVVLEARHGRRPETVALEPGAAAGRNPPEAVLLIGDKVVHTGNWASGYPHQLDLGEAWKQLTGLPFVFAAWLARGGEDLGGLPRTLADLRLRNRRRIPEIVAAHANGWPRDLALRYLGEILRYDVGEPELAAIELFWSRCHALGIIERLRPMRLYEEAQFSILNS
jgi:chorismate dehydratase